MTSAVEVMDEELVDYLSEHEEVANAFNIFIEDGYTVNGHFGSKRTDSSRETIRILLDTIKKFSLEKSIVTYRGVDKARMKVFDFLQNGEEFATTRFTSTTLIEEIAQSHSENVITILVLKGTNCVFLNSVNDTKYHKYGSSRNTELLFADKYYEEVDENFEAYSLLSGNTDDANGEEEILLPPGRLERLGFRLFLFKPL